MNVDRRQFFEHNVAPVGLFSGFRVTPERVIDFLNVLAMDDLMTNRSYPIIDESSRGTLRGMIRAIEGLLPLVDSETVVVPGHGPTGNRESLLGFRAMLCTIESRLKPLMASGSPVAGILAAAPTADFDPVWGRRYVTGDIFVRMILAGFGLAEKPKNTSATRGVRPLVRS